MNSNNGILWSKFGPKLEATTSTMRNADDTGAFRCLTISDLNPQIETTWVLTKWEMLQIGFWFLRRAFYPTKIKDSHNG
jgi:hypothetical protein